MGATTYAKLQLEQEDRKATWRTDYLAWLIEREGELELVEAVSLCRLYFRYRPHGLFDLSEQEVDNLNREIFESLHSSGRAGLSLKCLQGRFVLQASLMDQKAQSVELKSLIRDVLYLARWILGRSANASLG